MRILDVLQDDHNELRVLIDGLITASEDELKKNDTTRDWTKLFHDFKLSLVAHDRAEEAYFYDFLRTIEDCGPLIDARFEQHRIIEELLEDLEEIDPLDRTWLDKLALLKNQLFEHLDEEEERFFEVAKKYLTERDGETLADQYERLWDEIVDGVKYHPKGASIINPAGLELDRT